MADVEENIYEEVPSTGFDSEEKTGDSEEKTEDSEEKTGDSNAEAPRLSKASTVFISCSDASLKDPNDVPMDVNVTVGEGRSKSDGAVTDGQKVSEDMNVAAAARGNTIAALPHSDPFPEPNDDEDDGENAVERLAWDVSAPQDVQKKTTNPKNPPDNGAERDAGGNPKKNSAEIAEYENKSCLWNCLKPCRTPKRYSVKIQEKVSGQVTKTYSGEIAERDSGIIADRDDGIIANRDTGIIADRDAGFIADRDTGPEIYPGRTVMRDPADIPERHPGAADIDPMQALKRYLRNIAEEDSGGMRKRIVDKIADIENRKNQRRGEERDAGEIPRRSSNGFPKTSFGVLAPPSKVPQNGRKNTTFGFQPGPPKRKGRVPPKSKTFSTVSKTDDSTTETFYSYDAEGGEELRVLVDGWPQLEVTRAPGSLLYEGNWTDNPDTKIPEVKCKTSSVIEANGCKIRMDRRCDGQEESIALYKDDVLICKAGRKIV